MNYLLIGLLDTKFFLIQHQIIFGYLIFLFLLFIQTLQSKGQNPIAKIMAIP